MCTFNFGKKYILSLRIFNLISNVCTNNVWFFVFSKESNLPLHANNTGVHAPSGKLNDLLV